MTELDGRQALEALRDAPLPVLAVSDNRLVWANQQATALLDINSLLDKPLSSLPAQWRDMLLDNQTGRFDLANGSTHKFYRAIARTIDAVELYYLIDVTIEQALQEEVRYLKQDVEQKTQRDADTGLLNRLGLKQMLESQVARSRRYNNPLALIRMQIDGYAAPDHLPVLRAIAWLLNDQMRWADMIGCLEDDVVLFILPETSQQTATTLTDKIRGWLRELPVEGSGQPVTIDVSFGVAEWRKGDDSRTLLQRTEQALQ